jgi:hypothetical protein
MTDEPKLVYQMDELDELREKLLGDPKAEHWAEPRKPVNRGHVRQIIAALEMLPYGSISAYNSSGGHGDENPPPAGTVLDGHARADRFAHEYWSQKLLEAGDDEHAIAKVAEGAAKELAEWRGGMRPERLAEESKESMDARILEKAGWPEKDVANDFNCTPTYVRRVRQAHGRDVATGDPLVQPIDLDWERRRDEVKRLRTVENLSYRQIALRLGCGVETVRRDVAA